MPRVFDHHAFKGLIVGQSGHGKSVFQIRAAIANQARYKFIFDHKGEFHTRAAVPQCNTPDDIESALQNDTCAARWINFNPHVMFPGKTPEAFRFFCDFAWQLSYELGFNKLIVADELALITEGQAPTELMRVMEDGRGVGLDALFTSHGANALHNRIRGQFTEVVSFRLMSGPALEVMRDEYGFNLEHIAGVETPDGDRQGGLTPGEFIARNLETGVTQGGRVF